MKKKLKGGIETIIATIILTGIVIALIIAVVLPSARETADIGNTGMSTMSGLKTQIGG